MKDEQYVIGVDFGTDSVRSVIVETASGKESASSVYQYPRWKQGLYCHAASNLFRQHPLDHIEGLQETIRACIKEAGPEVAARIRAIGIDTTGSTPVAVDDSGQPLALDPEFSDNPNAMFVLWKDHTSVFEAAEINRHAGKFHPDHLQFVGGIYSSEWFWAKLLHILRTDEKVRKACTSWVEHCDWIPFLLTGGRHISEMKRSVCAAGHKALWADAFNGYPPNSFFTELDPLLDGFVHSLGNQTYTSDRPAGTLSADWAQRLGLSTDVVVAVGGFDAHMGAVGGQIEPYHLSKVMGTSTCDILVADPSDLAGRTVRGICGQVNGSVIPGMIGLEAGQSAFGDTYAWFVNMLLGPVNELLSSSPHIDQHQASQLSHELAEKMLPLLTEKAVSLPLSENDEFSTDWLNGRRTPDANQFLKGSIHGLSLGTDAARIFRSLVEATCFGARMIVERFRDEGIQVRGLIGLGGVAKRSPYIMQMMSDIIKLPIRIHKSEQTCAHGAAMFAATAAGIYTKVEDAMQAMGLGFDGIFHPDPEKAAHYDARFLLYKEAGRFTESRNIPL
jgi:L-ribulokinase